MQMPGGGMPQQGARMITPDQLVQMLSPLVAEATRIFDAGASMHSALREAVLAGFLMGRGATAPQAMQTVLQWRTSGASASLIRQMRNDAVGPMGMTGAPRETGTTGRPDATGTTGMTGRTGRPDTTGAAEGADTTGTSGRAEIASVPGPTGRMLDQDREDLVALLQTFMQNEANDAAFYRELIAQVQEPELKEYVRVPLEDEQKHYRMMGQLYQELTGRTYSAEPRRTEFPNLRAGLKMAMDGEYEAAERYRDVYLKYPEPRIRDLFFELLTDELEHATRFNYVLQAMGGA